MACPRLHAAGCRLRLVYKFASDLAAVSKKRLIKLNWLQA